MGLVWANNFTAAEFTGTGKYQSFTPNANIIVDRVRTWFVFINDPIFTSIHAKLYTVDDDLVPSQLIASSVDERTKAELLTDLHAYRETYFSFDNVCLEGSSYYALVINGTGYIPTTTSYIAWRHDYPDPINRNLSFSYIATSINRCPYRIYFRSTPA